MPLPKPIEGEDEETFVLRCISDETMIEEFPKLGQRFAVCKIQANTEDEDEDEDADEADEADEEEDSLDVLMKTIKEETEKRGDE